jgi:transcriptional regulator with XRE-family HTH domain
MSTEPPQERIAFARNFRKARKEADLNQDEIAAITGLTQSFISRVENGETSVSLINAKRLADALKQPLCKLINPEEK